MYFNFLFFKFKKIKSMNAKWVCTLKYSFLYHFIVCLSFNTPFVPFTTDPSIRIIFVLDILQISAVGFCCSELKASIELALIIICEHGVNYGDGC